MPRRPMAPTVWPPDRGEANSRQPTTEVRHNRPMTPTDRHDRPRDRWTALVTEWYDGCLKCDAPVSDRPLPGSDGQLYLPLCERHIRWAMASRRERLGKQAGYLKKLLLAWCRYRGAPTDLDTARDWLGY